MDPSRFDEFTRTFSLSRRNAVRTILGGAAAGLAALIPGGSVSAKPKDPFHRANKLCHRGQPCGELTACVNRVCLPQACLIDGVVYEPGDTNPDNPCEACRQTADYESWTNRTNGGSCPPPSDPEVCQSTFIGVCQDGACVPTDAPDDTPCGESTDPCTALACRAGDCVPVPANDGADCDNGVNGVCVNRFGTCQAGVCVGHQEPNGSACEGNNICCDGDCVAQQQCGDPDPGGGCQGDECDGICIIDGVTYDFGDHNSANNCQVCSESSERPTTFWKPAIDENTACGEPPMLRVCCSGVCCVASECCVLDSDGSPVCTIDNCP